MDELPIVKRLRAVDEKLTNDVLSLTLDDCETVKQAAALIRALADIADRADKIGSEMANRQTCPMILQHVVGLARAALAKAREA